MNINLTVDTSKLLEPVPKEHWSEYAVEPLQMIFSPEQVHTLTSEWSMRDEGSVCSLMVSRSQVIRPAILIKFSISNKWVINNIEIAFFSIIECSGDLILSKEFINKNLQSCKKKVFSIVNAQRRKIFF